MLPIVFVFEAVTGIDVDLVIIIFAGSGSTVDALVRRVINYT
jgi:hypothetical protein